MRRSGVFFEVSVNIYYSFTAVEIRKERLNCQRSTKCLHEINIQYSRHMLGVTEKAFIKSLNGQGSVLYLGLTLTLRLLLLLANPQNQPERLLVLSCYNMPTKHPLKQHNLNFPISNSLLHRTCPKHRLEYFISSLRNVK